MDLSDLRTIITALSFIAFIGVVIWAYNSNQKAAFDEAANLPFADKDELPAKHAGVADVRPERPERPGQQVDGGDLR